MPETWLPTETLVSTLNARKCDVLTITNHNNARSCYALQDKGIDVLVAAEFSCTLPDLKVGVHVLTFGFTPAQEARLNELRKDVYRFQEYCCRENIPTVLAHPLHYYSPTGMPPPALMDRFALLFERFEGINGQRDTRSNLLTVDWVQSLDIETLDAVSRRCGIPVDAFCRSPFRKRITGGSDCHMGIFAGTTGTLLHVPLLKGRREPRSQLALEALREGRVVPFGSGRGEDKLALAFLDYFCQAVLYMEDPGLLGVLLHTGDAMQKGMAMGIGNALFELRQSPSIVRFVGLLHASLLGKGPGLLARVFAPPRYRPMVRELAGLAKARNGDVSVYMDRLEKLLPLLYKGFSRIFCQRLNRSMESNADWKSIRFEDCVSMLDQPSRLRTFFGIRKPARLSPSDRGMAKSLEGLLFPFLGAAALAGASFAGDKILSDQIDFSEELATRLRNPKPSPRALWLTDTYGDRNGVSHALGAMLKEVQKNDLPIDFAICSSTIESEAHLIVLPPVAEFALPVYRDQNLRIPDLLDMQGFFRNGAYDRLVCSTEGPMGLIGLYLKHAFRVPAFSYLHTDWMDFARRSLEWKDAHLRRLQQILKRYYKAFDGVFVLNSEQKEWLSSPEMSLPKESVFSTAHWAESHFRPVSGARERLYPDLREKPILLYVGRLSEEKGVFELPAIFRSARSAIPDVEMLVAGTGPAEARLRREFPEARYLGWISHEDLPGLYSSADILLLPSRFDTFGCVILEAFNCGLPVIAYDTKGPRDLIENGKSGFLANTISDFEEGISLLLQDPDKLEYCRVQALRRGRDYRREDILKQLLSDLGLGEGKGKSRPGNVKSESHMENSLKTSAC
ncbi:MAG: hypothetical protein JWO30_4959 [Fibrobacteres bacterium]|nr:hypothetical protein [Fibrobacterota bacterium]